MSNLPDYFWRPQRSCTCFLGHPPCSWCTEQSSCDGCGKSFHDPDAAAICEDCQYNYTRKLQLHLAYCSCAACIAFMSAADPIEGFALAVPLLIEQERAS